MNQNQTTNVVFGRRIFFLVSVLSVLTGGCVMGPRPVPQWAMHIKPPIVNETGLSKPLLHKLERNLTKEILPANYIPAEQIAALAVKEIKSGRGWDAALLMTLASYRYHQQAIYASRMANNIPNNISINKEIYNNFVKTEIDIFSSRNFDEELNYTAAQLLRDDKVTKMFENDYWRALSQEGAKREEMFKDFLQNVEENYIAPPERISNKHLSQALLSRLIEDTRTKHSDSFANYYLAIAPFREYRLAALRETNRFFFTPICQNLAPRLSQLRKEITASLDSTRSQTRSNAAIILGLRPSAENLALLETYYQKEESDHARLSFEFAFIKNNKEELLKKLTAAIRDCDEKDGLCDHALHLLQWLPIEQKQKISHAALAKVLKDSRNTNFSRMFAAVILRDIGLESKLGRSIIQTLITASGDKNEQISSWAGEAIAGLKQLDHEQVLTMLRENKTNRWALIYRLSHVVEPADIGFLKTELREKRIRSEREQNAFIKTLQKIPGNKATLLLFESFTKNPEMRIGVAMSLVERGDTPFNRLLNLAAKDKGIGSLIIKMHVKADDAIPFARTLLKGGTLDQRIQTAQLVSVFERRQLLPDLWQLASYNHSGYYPADAIVRHAALRSILRLKLLGRKELFSDPLSEIKTGIDSAPKSQ
ncbi:MAG: hypothetical protein GY847_35780 [Proteobacteria bacterium]|nr:hypothetical protein [Pseudomonadota bacterium]